VSSRPALTLRHADPVRDAAACAAIYGPYVEGTAMSFEEVAPDAAQFQTRIATTIEKHPWLVLADGDDRAVGFAYASPHRTRAAYRWACEVGIYLAPAAQGQGAGRRLYGALIELLRRQGLRTAIAGITLPNDASLGLHRALGFEQYGTQRGIGWKAGAWRDVSWWQLELAAPSGEGDGPPPEPLGPQRLGEADGV
jgi:L-amino acid N-acyltransferase YncA